MCAMFGKGREGFAAADLDWDAHKLNCILADMDDAGPSAGAYKVTGATGTTTVTITTQAAHGLSVNDEVEVFSITGISNVNGVQTVASTPSGTQFTFTPATAASGTYTAGTGYIADLSLQFLSEFLPSGGRVATMEIPTAGRSVLNGTLDAADITFSSVTGDPVEAFIIVKAGNTPGGADVADTAQRLILIQTPATPGLTGLPITPNGGNINLTFNASGIARL